MRITQDLIESLAERVERAYRLRRNDWNAGCSTSRVWGAAALVLVRAHREDPRLPLDPELYVAVQPLKGASTDPWTALADPEAGRRYRDRVLGIIRGLEAELEGEVARAERRLDRGEAVEIVVASAGPACSPLGRFIVACRAGRSDLATGLVPEVVAQHQACPLYRLASRQLLPAGCYPEAAPAPDPLAAPRGCDLRTITLAN